MTPGLRVSLPHDIRMEALFTYGESDDQSNSYRGINNTALAARPRLDAVPGTRLPTLPGKVPELPDLPPGCPFVDRCDRQVPACHQEPPLHLPGPLHSVRCVRPYPVPPAVPPQETAA